MQLTETQKKYFKALLPAMRQTFIKEYNLNAWRGDKVFICRDKAMLTCTRFWDDDRVIHEATRYKLTVKDLIMNPKSSLWQGLKNAAESDFWYTFEKEY